MSKFDIIEGPDDIFQTILSYLDKNSLSSSESLCRKWRQYISSRRFWMNLLEYELPNYFTVEISPRIAKSKLKAWSAKDFKWKTIGKATIDI